MKGRRVTQRRKTHRRKANYAITFPDRRSGYDRRCVPDRRNLYKKSIENL